MFRIAAKIEGAWQKCWRCGCKPTEEEKERWESTRQSIIRKHWNPGEQERLLKEDGNVMFDRDS